MKYVLVKNKTIRFGDVVRVNEDRKLDLAKPGDTNILGSLPAKVKFLDGGIVKSLSFRGFP